MPSPMATMPFFSHSKESTHQKFPDSPSWIWDVSRQRILWADRQALDFFEVETPFDLFEEKFSPEDPFVKKLAAFSEEYPIYLEKKIKTDHIPLEKQGQILSLEFPSLGKNGKVALCFCVPCLLEGKSLGVRVYLNPSFQKEEPYDRRGLFDFLPLAILVFDGKGAVIDFNPEAKKLFFCYGSFLPLNIFTLFPTLTSQILNSLIQKNDHGGGYSKIFSLEKQGEKIDVRIFVRRLFPNQDLFFMVAEDVTERRALERFLSSRIFSDSSPKKTSLSPHFFQNDSEGQTETEIFESLGNKILEETNRASAHDFTKNGVLPHAHHALDSLFFLNGAALPPALADLEKTLEGAPYAVILCHNSEMIYANSAACKILKYSDKNSLLMRHDIARLLNACEDSIKTLKIPDGYGVPISLQVRFSRVQTQEGLILKIELSSTVAPTPSSGYEGFAMRDQDFALSLCDPLCPTFQDEAPPNTFQQKAPEQNFFSSNFSSKTAVENNTPYIKKTADQEAKPEKILHSQFKETDVTEADGLVTLDRMGFILSLSSGASSLLEMPPQEVLNRHISEFIAQESRITFRHALEKSDQEDFKGEVEGQEIVGLTATGKRIPLSMNIAKMHKNNAILQNQRGAASFCIILKRPKNLRAIEENLRLAKENAEKANSQKTLFLARVSHELRTPLNAILGFSEVMRTERLGQMNNPKYLAYAHDIHTSGTYLLALINDLLDLSKIESGKIELQKESIFLHDVCETALKLIEQQALEKQIIIRKQFDQNAPPVIGDLRSFKQILLNILSNAVKFTPNGGQIFISSFVRADKKVGLRIRDTGIGMTEEELKTIFEPFSRTSAARKIDETGTGLGLSLAQALADVNHVDLQVISQPGEGTTITLIFGE